MLIHIHIYHCLNAANRADLPHLYSTVKPVLSSHTREAQKVAAKGRWLLNRGEYQYKISVWEHFVWLLKTGGLLNGDDR